jgi:hypothetical protein
MIRRRGYPMLLSLLLFAANERSTAAADGVEAYHIDSRLEQLIAVFFPSSIPHAGVTVAHHQRFAQPRFVDLEGVFAFHSKGMHLRPDTAGVQHWPVMPLESYWLTMAPENGRAKQLLQQVLPLAPVAEELTRADVRFNSCLEKALVQRDLFQICRVLLLALENCDEENKSDVSDLLRDVYAIWKKCWLSAAEFQEISNLLPVRIYDNFSQTNRFDLNDDYLPPRVIRDQAGWFDLSFVEETSEHFRQFAGGNFITIWIKPVGHDANRFNEYWRKTYAEYRETLTRSGGAAPLPAGTETLLVRSMGVFMEDGSFADAKFPEEVLIRIFKSERSRLDIQTSDSRGTLQYQYKLNRASLLRNPSSLGLVRVMDDSSQFFGFLSEVPDPQHSYSEVLTTMRNNCISCHSEVHYGINTVFSLARKSKPIESSTSLEGGHLRKMNRNNRYQVQTEFLNALRALCEN